MAGLREGLEDALTYLPSALDEPFADHPLAGVLKREVPAAMAAVIDDPAYELEGSPGRRRWAETVWVAAFDHLVTDNAQRG